MKIKGSLSTIFIVVSAFVFMLGSYLLATRTSLRPQFFITACVEVLRNVSEHVHFNPDGVVSILILLVALISMSLAVLQLTKFFTAYRRLLTLRTSNSIPHKLQWVVNKHSLKKSSVSVISGATVTAYTIGLLKPRIVISQSLVSNVTKHELEAVVLHELYHLKNRHVLWLLVSQVISSVFFFIPFIQYLARQLKIEFELAADAFVVEKQKTKDHLCDSLALNLQYAGGVIPHFATTPIERRVESLLGNKLSPERMGIKTVAVSTFSLLVMLGIAFVQPSQATANFAFGTSEVCSVGDSCQNTDCSGKQIEDMHNFTPFVPASFSL